MILLLPVFCGAKTGPCPRRSKETCCNQPSAIFWLERAHHPGDDRIVRNFLIPAVVHQEHGGTIAAHGYGSDISDLAKILHLNGGELIGKTRLQKSFYFLEKIGVGFGFNFQYHHYGPYSEELTTAAQDAIALGLVKQEKRVGSHA
jgi:hypothetical protein